MRGVASRTPLGDARFAPPVHPPPEGKPPQILRAEDSLSAPQVRVLKSVRGRPGATILDVSLAIGCSHATATYHLSNLCKLRLLHQVRDGREVRHFDGPQRPDPRTYLEALARDPRKTRVIAEVACRGPAFTTLNGLAKKLDLPYGFVKRTLLQLHWLGLIELERRYYRYSVRRLVDFSAPAEPSEDGIPWEAAPTGI